MSPSRPFIDSSGKRGKPKVDIIPPIPFTQKIAQYGLEGSRIVIIFPTGYKCYFSKKDMKKFAEWVLKNV